ncbi:retrovirus-related pol polyprotein from transposon TNT 1-94 [Tanacetum coccineum]
MFQSIFNEYFQPSPNVVSHVLPAIAPILTDTTGTPSSTSIDQDAPTAIEPKNYKEALLESLWIKAMQEEIHEFERLQVWELVPRPYYIMMIRLKWIFKVKLDEFRGVLKNKERLKKALYGLKQAPSAWYDILSKFLLSQKFSKGDVDPTQFTRKEEKDILLVQIYVDDIILLLLILLFVIHLLKY